MFLNTELCYKVVAVH